MDGGRKKVRFPTEN